MRLEAPTVEPYTGGGAKRGNVRQMSSIQAWTASSDQSAVLRGLKNAHHPPCFSPSAPPYFLVNPPCFLCPGSPLPVRFFHTAVLHLASPQPGSHLWFSLSVGLLVFPPLFSPHSFLQGLSGLVNSSGCQISLHCLLGGDILSSLQRSQPTSLFDQALDPLTSLAVCFEFWGIPWLKSAQPASNSLLSGLCVFCRQACVLDLSQSQTGKRLLKLGRRAGKHAAASVPSLRAG